MFIQTEQTPNPLSLKFLPGCEVATGGAADFKSATAAAGASPLAARLFKIAGVEGVFLGRDFITVTKAPTADWAAVKLAALAAIMEHFMSGEPVTTAEIMAAGAAEDDSDAVKQIKEILETRVRPIVARDGGDIMFASFEDGVVYVHMKGACAGCPSSTATLRGGVENMLKHFVPEVTEVRAV